MSVALGDRVDRVGDQSVRSAVHGLGSLFVGGVHETEDLAVALIDPVAQVVHAVRVLGGEICGVCLGYVVQRNGGLEVMHVHEQSHRSTPPVWLVRTGLSVPPVDRVRAPGNIGPTPYVGGAAP